MSDLDYTKPPFVPDAEGDAPPPSFFQKHWAEFVAEHQARKSIDAQHPPRQYRLSFDVVVVNQNDFKNFQPDTVTAGIVGTAVKVVGDNDSEALRMLLTFLFQGVYNGVYNSYSGGEIDSFLGAVEITHVVKESANSAG